MKWTVTRIATLWLGLLLGLVGFWSGCDVSLPEPPPDVLIPYNTVKVGWGPVFLAHGDLNRDGNQDLVVANSKDHTLTFLFGRGDGTFESPQTLPVPVEPSHIVITDINHDNTPDLLFNSEGGEAFQVLLGKGGGTFHPMQRFRPGRYPSPSSSATTTATATRTWR
ncbi:hypothetical protein NITGR_620011 [Nitrospina gracilis 3/211]|uniref:VCBS repeat-containing protein n=1 Tax=Nitrospina gracilis (strain 3/211) TaxID=1266370 RepID=M1ZD28_NITG3|nr:VCBS repeat-containing protein [Nitrospina gracilis]CCQ91314.1 hypothetical protein NITGR_620011 [Nitrospina gracilis 3/211]